LALALGLSDVIERARGNICLDAIFIDEGSEAPIPMVMPAP
jgi:hypothetical protein